MSSQAETARQISRLLEEYDYRTQAWILNLVLTQQNPDVTDNLNTLRKDR